MAEPRPSRPGVAQAMGWATVTTVELLLPLTESVEVVETVAVLLSDVDTAGAVTTMLIVVEAPLAIVPMVQTTLAVWVQEPLGVAETKVVPAGMVSATETPAALPRPRFWT